MILANVGPCIFKALIIGVHELMLFELEGVVHLQDFVGCRVVILLLEEALTLLLGELMVSLPCDLGLGNYTVRVLLEEFDTFFGLVPQLFDRFNHGVEDL